MMISKNKIIKNHHNFKEQLRVWPRACLPGPGWRAPRGRRPGAGTLEPGEAGTLVGAGSDTAEERNQPDPQCKPGLQFSAGRVSERTEAGRGSAVASAATSTDCVPGRRAACASPPHGRARSRHGHRPRRPLPRVSPRAGCSAPAARPASLRCFPRRGPAGRPRSDGSRQPRRLGPLAPGRSQLAAAHRAPPATPFVVRPHGTGRPRVPGTNPTSGRRAPKRQQRKG